MRFRLPLLAALGLSIGLVASAATLVPAKSELIFNFKQMGVAVDGSFKSSRPSWTSTPEARGRQDRLHGGPRQRLAG